MKVTFIAILFLIILYTNFASAQVDLPKPYSKCYIEFDYYTLVGRYEIEESFIKDTDKCYKVYYKQFNSDDRDAKIYQVNYYLDNKIKDSAYYHYFQNSNKIKKITFKMQGGEVFSEHFFNYDAVKQQIFVCANLFTSKEKCFTSEETILTYDNIRLYHTRYSPDYQIMVKEKYFYDESNRLIQIMQNYKESEKKVLVSYNYEKDNLILKQETDQEDKIISKTTYQYDENGNISSSISTFFNKYENIYLEERSTYNQYYKALIKTKIYFNANGKKIKSETVNRKGVTVYYDKNDNEINYSQFLQLK